MIISRFKRTLFIALCASLASGCGDQSETPEEATKASNSQSQLEKDFLTMERERLARENASAVKPLPNVDIDLGNVEVEPDYSEYHGSLQNDLARENLEGRLRTIEQNIELREARNAVNRSRKSTP